MNRRLKIITVVGIVLVALVATWAALKKRAEDDLMRFEVDGRNQLMKMDREHAEARRRASPN